MIIKLYKNYLPEKYRKFIYEIFLGKFLHFKRHLRINIKLKWIYFFNVFFLKTTENELYAFMGKHGLTPLPYQFGLKYKKMKVECNIGENQLPYVLHNSKKLYFPLGYSFKRIIHEYKELIMEQDIESPHRYVTSFSEMVGKTLLDIGAAEAIFSLDTIEYVDHVYIFECDEKWLKPLEATFRNWKEKVTIIRKFVDENNDENRISIDEFLKDKNLDNIFIKMDIEGAEISALKGASATLKHTKHIGLAICTYHKKQDAIDIESILSSYSLNTLFTKGFMFFEKDFRKGVIRAFKGNS